MASVVVVTSGPVVGVTEVVVVVASTSVVVDVGSVGLESVSVSVAVVPGV